MKKYSVMLLRPDYMACCSESADTFYTHVKARNVKAAVYTARQEAMSSDCAELDMPPEDYAVLLVIDGHHSDISHEMYARLRTKKVK